MEGSEFEVRSRFVSSPRHPYRFWGSPSFQPSGYRRLSPQTSRDRSPKMDAYLQLVSWSRIRIAIQHRAYVFAFHKSYQFLTSWIWEPRLFVVQRPLFHNFYSHYNNYLQASCYLRRQYGTKGSVRVVYVRLENELDYIHTYIRPMPAWCYDDDDSLPTEQAQCVTLSVQPQWVDSDLK